MGCLNKLKSAAQLKWWLRRYLNFTTLEQSGYNRKNPYIRTSTIVSKQCSISDQPLIIATHMNLELYDTNGTIRTHYFKIHIDDKNGLS